MTPPPPPSPPPPSPPPPSPPPPTPTPPMPMTPPCLTDPDKEWPCLKNCHLTDPNQTTTCKDKCTPCVPPSSPPSPCLPPPPLWECISECHLTDNDQTTNCKDKCTPCPEPPSAPSAPPFCEDELKTDRDKLEKCKDQEFTTKCKETCGYCTTSSAVDLGPQSLKTTETDNGDSTVMLIGGGVAAIALLALLFFASRPSTRAFVRKAFGSAGGVQSTAAGQNSPTAASTSAAN